MSYFSNGEHGEKLTMEAVTVLNSPSWSTFRRQYRDVKNVISNLTTLAATFFYNRMSLGKEKEVGYEARFLEP